MFACLFRELWLTPPLWPSFAAGNILLQYRQHDKSHLPPNVVKAGEVRMGEHVFKLARCLSRRTGLAPTEKRVEKSTEASFSLCGFTKSVRVWCLTHRKVAAESCQCPTVVVQKSCWYSVAFGSTFDHADVGAEFGWVSWGFVCKITNNSLSIFCMAYRLGSTN